MSLQTVETISQQKKLDSTEICYSQLKNNIKGVALGEEDWFLQVEKKKKLWRLHLVDLFSGDNLTGWVKLLDLEELRRSRRAKPIRDRLKTRWQNVDEIIERTLIEVEDSESEWQNKNEQQTIPQENVDFNMETVERAWTLLRDPTFFYKLGKIFEYGFTVPKINKPRFIIGEERNKRLLGPLLIGASILGMTSIIKLLGDPGTAKDTMLRMWLLLLPIRSIERSYITAASLRYSKEMKNAQLIYIPDSPELRGEMGRHMRFMRADDGGLISEYATRDNETGEMTTKTVRLPVKAVATTSNAITGDTALESGMWTLKTNGSETLTRKVKREKLKFRAGKRQLFPEDELKIWKCAFHILVTEDLPSQLCRVPFAENLITILESERSESRRDPDKLCDLISLMAWMRRFQKDPDKRDEADVVDLYFALQIGLDAITETIAELDEREQRIFQAVKKAVGEDVTCRYVADETKIPYKTCYRYLEKLIDKGFLLKDKKQGRNVYSVFSEKQPKELLIEEGRNLENPEQLIKFILQSFGNFSLSHQEASIISFVDPITGQKISVTQGQHKEVSIKVQNQTGMYPYTGLNNGTTPENNMSIPREKVRKSERSKKTTLKTENKVKSFLPSKMRNKKQRSNPEKPEDLFQCPICKRFGKPMFFVSEEDLKLHVQQLHNRQASYNEKSLRGDRHG